MSKGKTNGVHTIQCLKVWRCQRGKQMEYIQFNGLKKRNKQWSEKNYIKAKYWATENPGMNSTNHMSHVKL